MEFSSSEESVVEDRSEKDTKFSLDEDKKYSDTPDKVAKDRVPTTTSPLKLKERQNKEEEESGLNIGLERLKISSSMPASSPSRLPSLESLKAQKHVKKEKNTAELSTKKDEIKDTKLSSSEESTVEDGGEKDMEFSDEDKES
ncbi:hypothetical protein C0992_009443 [Termitomyces sp. T32_za158]|nr:hypothetical protein C0992_009443 [Termitomyces sp. T32_za158]